MGSIKILHFNSRRRVTTCARREAGSGDNLHKIPATFGLFEQAAASQRS
jgi:hypothetical protein